MGVQETSAGVPQEKPSSSASNVNTPSNLKTQKPERKSVVDIVHPEQNTKIRPEILQPFIREKKIPLTYEDLQYIVGISGRWQLRIFLLAAFSGFCLSTHNLIYGFIGVIPDHWCEIPDLPGVNQEELRNKLTPSDDSKCTQYPWNWTHIDGGSVYVDNTTVQTCSKFTFNHSEFQSTVPTSFNLVCEASSWVSSIQITYMTGLLLGAPIFGAISDRIGRKSAVFIATMIISVTGPLIAMSPNFYVFVILRFILAFALPGAFQCSYVLAIELISERWRALAGSCFNISFAIGYTTLPVIAYFVRDWRTLQLICSVPGMLLMVTWWLMPESPRWLIRKGYLEKAETILRKGAKENRREHKIPERFSELIKEIYEQEREPKKTKTTCCSKFGNLLNEYFSILRSPKMRAMFLTLLLSWMVIGMTYYGLALNSSNLNTDRYTHVFINGLLEFPAYLMVPFLIKYMGRKKVFIGFMWICGASLWISLFLEQGSVYIVLLSYLGKLVIGANYSLVYLYSSELLPTLVRNCALGVCSMMGRFGSTIAPLIVDVVGRGHHMYPCLIFGGLAIFAGCLSLILPETQNRRLPETIEEVENGSGQKTRIRRDSGFFRAKPTKLTNNNVDSEVGDVGVN